MYGKLDQRTEPTAGVDLASYRLLVDSIPDYAIFMLDPEGRVMTWNLGAQRIKGYLAEEIIGQHFSVFYPPGPLAEAWPEHELAMARTTGHFEDEGWRIRKDGSRFWANVLLTPLYEPDGSLLGYAKITRDLTARRQQEELLRRSEEHFRLLVDGVRDYAIFMLDPQGRVASWNTGAQQTKGYRADEIIGQHFSVFYPPDVVARGWPEYELEQARREGRFEDEGWRLRKDGSRFWASVVISALRDEGGRHIGFAKVTRDLTDKRRVHALEDEGKRITTFLAMLGHELRNPLAPIANAVSILQMAPIESAQVRMCRDVIGRQVRQLTRLVDDLLDVGRITAGKIHLELKPVELGAVLLDAVEALQPTATSRAQTLTLDLAGAPAWVDGDRARLLQVCQNLLNNAVKFTHQGGDIRAALRSDENHAEIVISDNGPGVPPHRSNDIFNLFVQGEGNDGHGQDGLGVGLSLVQQLVALHGGEISLFSTGQPGDGAEFVVRLARQRTPRDAAHA